MAGDRVFDFQSDNASDTVPAAPLSPAGSCLFLNQANETASAAYPIFTLSAAAAGNTASHHLYGSFLHPSKGLLFQIEKNGAAESWPLLSIDSRFVDLIRHLGENHYRIRLSIKKGDSACSVLKMRAVDASLSIAPSRDAFLQLVLSRLFLSHPADRIEDDETDTVSPEDTAILRDIHDFSTFLCCARNTLPKNIQTWAERNMTIIRQNTVSPEERRHAQRALSMMLNIQWKGSYFPSIDPIKARQILDEELYGLDRVKQRIIETIIQINRTHTLPAYGLLLVGPAGIGKSQIAYSVARILHLPWTTLDMSAIRDAESLTGSPRLYTNAKPGRIMEAYSEAHSSNLVFIINELDKADHDATNGNPADALLTLLDNLGFTDNYMECTIPTDGVYPIATANDLDRISAPLRSRFAIIHIPDYTQEEKMVIFRKFSLPKVLSRMGMTSEECQITDEALRFVLSAYADTTGVRDLEQAAEHLAANALYQIETKHLSHVLFDTEHVKQLMDM